MRSEGTEVSRYGGVKVRAEGANRAEYNRIENSRIEHCAARLDGVVWSGWRW